jgi:hypothetical protein
VTCRLWGPSGQVALWGGNYLWTVSGVDELKQRINDVAQEECHQLDTLYPNGAMPGTKHTNENCVKDAVAGLIFQQPCWSRGLGHAAWGSVVPADVRILDAAVLLDRSMRFELVQRP